MDAVRYGFTTTEEYKHLLYLDVLPANTIIRRHDGKMLAPIATRMGPVELVIHDPKV